MYALGLGGALPKEGSVVNREKLIAGKKGITRATSGHATSSLDVPVRLLFFTLQPPSTGVDCPLI